MLLAQIILHHKLILRQQSTIQKKRIFWHILSYKFFDNQRVDPVSPNHVKEE